MIDFSPAPDPVPSIRHLAILGSTGSIGTQALDIVRLFPERFGVDVLTAGRNAELLAKQAREFSPSRVVIVDEQAYEQLCDDLSDVDIDVRCGEEELAEAAAVDSVDVVIAAVVGFAGFAPTLRALRAGKLVGLANKETLVVGGALIKQALSEGEGTIVPVDSEHSAIYQCLRGEEASSVESLLLTASGGPFRTRPAHTFEDITLEEALDHPNWSMGAKITIDSATMMNKGLEVIEAQWLFDIPVEDIKVVVHPQSIIHSMVTFHDGAVKAQLGVPDMKVPIQYAMSYPERWPAPHDRLDWSALSRMDFEQPDLQKFPCLRLAFEASRAGGSAPAILNAANEQAVQLFLDRKLRFVEIPERIEEALAELAGSSLSTLDELRQIDARVRQHVQEHAVRTSNSTLT